MNRAVMYRVVLPLIAALSLPACGTEPAPTPPLEGSSLGGDFTLTSENGERISLSDFDGQYRTLYFGYAFCPDVCPTDNQRAMAGLKLFEKDEPELAAKIQPLFVSVDPDRDTTEVLGEFTDAFHPRLVGMTGSAEEIAAIAPLYGVFYSVPEERGEGYLVDHSNITFLIGPDGQPMATLPTDQGPQAVRDELAKWVR